MDSRVGIEGNFTKSVNSAMQQNYVPVIRNLVLRDDFDCVTDAEQSGGSGIRPIPRQPGLIENTLWGKESKKVFGRCWKTAISPQ